jgi:multidrug/hemolysin transport system permease protein
MKQFWALNKRNIKLYFKDHSAVFFSLLSMLIVIMLMVFFLGNMANASILNAVKDIPGRDLATDTLRVKEMVYLWTVAGIITINAASVTHSFYTNMIKDRGDNKLNSILVMPIKRSHITASFVFGAWFVSVIMGCLTLLVTQIIGVFRGFEVLSFVTILKVLLIISLNALVYASIMFFFASIVKSESAWGAIGIIIGTLSGFLGGIYLSVGDLSEGVVKVLKCFPFIYGTSALREVMLDATEDIFFEGTPEIIRESVDAAMGNSLTLFEKELLGGQKMGILLLVGLVFMFLSTLIITFSKKKDR